MRKIVQNIALLLYFLVLFHISLILGKSNVSKRRKRDFLINAQSGVQD